MRKTLTKITIFTLLVVLVATTFSACSFFDKLFETAGDVRLVTDVSIAVVKGLTNRDGKYVAVAGESFELEIILNEKAPAKPEYKWYLTLDGKKETIEGQTESILIYTFDEYTESVFEFSASANGVESDNTISVVMDYAEGVAKAEITSSSHEIIEGVIQQKLKNLSPITLKANWNKNSLPEDMEVSISWTLNYSSTVVCEDEEYVFTPDGEGTTIINLILCDGETTTSTSLKVVVVESFEAIERVNLTIESGYDSEIGEGVYTQYYQKVVSEDRKPVTVTISTTPEGKTNLEAPATWIVRDKYGERILPETGRTATFTPTYGENMVIAIVENVESKNVTLFALTDNDYSNNMPYIQDVFLWDSGVENAYITDQTDLNRFVQHMVSTRKVTAIVDNKIQGEGNEFPFTTSNEFDFIEDETLDNALQNALASIDEAGFVRTTTSYMEEQSTGELYDYKLYLIDNSLFMNPQNHYSPAEDVTQMENVILHYELLPSHQRREVLPIDDNPEYPEAIKDSQMLFRVVGWGYKPIFDGSVESQKMKTLYENIRQVATSYVTDEMSDYTKALIFYEWIAQKVDYDYALVENTSLSTEEELTYSAYSLEGVFADADGEGYGQAVCDGRAKAYVILCGLEDITALRITGEAHVGGVVEGHAWNKVLIDANGDGVKEWYFCDTTWSDRSSASDRAEMLNKQYFLVTDDYVSLTHVADDKMKNPACTTIFDYYRNTIVENGDKDFTLYVDSYEDLRRAVVYAATNDLIIEIKVDTSYVKTLMALQSKVQSILLTNMAGTLDNIIQIAASNNYGIFTLIFR